MMYRIWPRNSAVKAFGCRKSIAVSFVDRINAFHVTAAQQSNDSNLNLGRGADGC